ncbi:PLP-dependent transferase [Martelella mediterranea]|uniref:trans-sulfuration enzyme family protein n=1 Tax=Martelella mediterranea TaxID=293089 RepID=UPI001E2AF85F|nr:PLP-dependent transferase [Martelella mediterranea]MCD1635360.1 PLP-dependent transferase [Martelella mediterranea]
MRDATKSVHHPKISEEGYAALGVPTHRASTIVFPDAEAYATRSQRDLDSYSYGLHGTPTQRVLEAQLTALENGLKTVILPSGQAAIAVVMLSCLKPGDHVLVADNAYPPVIGLCRNFLEPRGIEWSVFEPGIGAGIEGDVRDNTRLIWMESPGSTTMEIEDVPAITAIAKRRGILTGIDNTWATPLLFKPLDHGVDFSMQALTKYPGGHSDLLMGSVSVNDLDLRKALRDTMRMLGFGVSPDAVQLVLRGLETMAVRLAHVGRVAGEIAAELESRDVGPVLFPALASSPGHAIWKRDFTGASGLFSVVLPVEHEARLDAALNGLRYFAIGASWGGTRSLIAPMSVKTSRQMPHPHKDRIILRVNIGVEDPSDLREDLDGFFTALGGSQVTCSI